MAILVTQAGLEVWTHGAGKAVVSQVGLEVWVANAGRIIVSQIGVELWIDSQPHAINAAGNADGFATAYSITGDAWQTKGRADGQAHVYDFELHIGQAIILDMGI